MDDTAAIQTAARRFWFTYWFGNYEELQRMENWQVEKLFEPGWDYSDKAYRIFPRYRLNKAIQVEVERLTGYPPVLLDEMRTQLLRVCDSAETRLLEELKKPIAQAALHEESEDFRIYVRALMTSDLRQIEPLPFRRVIAESESKALWSQLGKIWGIGEDYWFPLKDGPVPANVVAFHTDYFERMNGEALLRDTLQKRDIKRVFQLHEFGDPEYEVETSEVESWYRDGGERYCTTPQADWLAYASHESSVTIGGEWLVQAFSKAWPDFRERSYLGPYSTEDLRGTWETK